MKYFAAALLLVAAPLAPAAASPVASAEAARFTRLDIIATGAVSRVPDVARITAGVVTLASTAKEAMAQDAQKMAAMRAALRRAGIAERDIQTSDLSLDPQYRDEAGTSPRLTGYRASSQLNIVFSDIAGAGTIVDALVAQGANTISGPSLEIGRPEAALDEARTAALAIARARAELYARAAGLRVARIVAISEGEPAQAFPGPMAQARRMVATQISPGEQKLTATLAVTFDLE